MALLRRLADHGIHFTVDGGKWNGNEAPMDVTFLEHMMRRTGGFVAIVPDRSTVDTPAWSPYQAFEYGLAIRSRKPRLIIAENRIPAGPLVGSDRTRMLYFDRESNDFADHGDPSTIDRQISSFVSRAREHVRPAQHESAPAFLLTDTSSPLEAVRREVELRGKKKNGDFFKVDRFELSGQSSNLDIEVLGRMESIDVVVADFGSDSTPEHILALIHASSVACLRICRLSPDEDENQARQRLGLLLSEAAAARSAPPLLAGYQLDERMEPVHFWSDADQGSVADYIVDKLKEHQDRGRDLHYVKDVIEYLLSIGGRRVFVSNANSQNDRAVAIATGLKAAGFPCFQYMEESNQKTGELIENLKKEVGAASLFLAIIDDDYWESEFCRLELELAVEKWTRRELRFLIFNGSDRRRLPDFLTVDRYFELEKAKSPAVVEHVTSILGKDAPRPIDEASATRIRELVEPQLSDTNDLRRIVEGDARLAPDEVDRLLKEVEDVDAKNLLPTLISLAEVDAAGNAALAALLSAALRYVSHDKDRQWLRKILTRERLYPNLQSFVRWARFASTSESQWEPATGPVQKVFEMVVPLAGDSAKWRDVTWKTGALLASEQRTDEDGCTPLIESNARLCIRGDRKSLSMPWEWMHMSGAGDPLGRRRPVRRYLTDLSIDSFPLPIDEALARGEMPPPRVLVVGSRAPGLPNVDDELAEVRDILAARFEVLGWPVSNVRVLSAMTATPDELENQLRENQFQMVHFAGHAGFESGVPYLQLNPTDDPKGRVYGADLRRWVSGHDVRFVFLNVCTSALPDISTDERVGVQTLASDLVEGGVTEVVAHVWPIADDVAPRLASDFYEELVKTDFDAGRALMVARRSQSLDSPGWATPLLIGQYPTRERLFSSVDVPFHD
ncbi:MAG: CHAT domain-containing protein [Deltaproteobacteria bacterium]